MEFKQFKRFGKKQAGMTLMEVIASLAVMAIVVVGALSLYNSANSSEMSTSMSKDISAIRAATQSIYQGQGTYGSSQNLNNVLVSANKIPTSIRVDTSTTPNTLTHRGNGTVNIVSTAAGTGFTIALTNIQKDVCIPLISQSAGGWTSIQVTGASARTTFPVSPVNAESDCSLGTTITYTAS